jgi:hypothetical protein
MLIVPTLRVGMHPRTLRVHPGLKPVPQDVRVAFSGTGFSREEAGAGTLNPAV